MIIIRANDVRGGCQVAVAAGSDGSDIGLAHAAGRILAAQPGSNSARLAHSFAS